MVNLGLPVSRLLDEATAKIEQLEAEKRALLSELMTTRAQLEHVLATLRQTYEGVRAEQERESSYGRPCIS